VTLLFASPPKTHLHEESPPPTTRSHEQFLSLTKAGPTHGGRSEGSEAPHEHGVAPTLEPPPGDDTQGSNSPRHASAPAGSTNGQPVLTGAVMLHCTPSQLPTRRLVRPLQHANPVRASTQVPSMDGTYLHLGHNVEDLIHTQGS
jgi:hypothetical protein